MRLHDRLFSERAGSDAVARWAASGAMALTGPSDGPPLPPPASLVPAVDAAANEVACLSEQLGRRVDFDALALLGERAALSGFSRRGRTSCGRGTELLASADEWVAVALSRAEDRELLPAWLGTDDVPRAIAARTATDLVEMAGELGLAVARLGEVGTGAPAWRLLDSGGRPMRAMADVVVVDLSSLWAGPLAGSVLALAGARVLKVESRTRPDGARSGPRPFFDLLNAGKEAVAFDFGDAGDLAVLDRLLRRADVVIEASRPRALAQLGIDAAQIVAEHGTVWLSITGHGRESGMRIAFGDDAAVAGGLVAGSRQQPWFCADALADPLTGLIGAAVVLDLLSIGRRALVDVALAGVAAWCARLPAALADWEGPVAAPRARPPASPARPLGADTAAVVVDLGLR